MSTEDDRDDRWKLSPRIPERFSKGDALYLLLSIDGNDKDRTMSATTDGWHDTLIGKDVVLKGITQKGKNRIYRGGQTWHVERYAVGQGYFLESVEKGPRECFWAHLEEGDPNVSVIGVLA